MKTTPTTTGGGKSRPNTTNTPASVQTESRKAPTEFVTLAIRKDDAGSYVDTTRELIKYGIAPFPETFENLSGDEAADATVDLCLTYLTQNAGTEGEANAIRIVSDLRALLRFIEKSDEPYPDGYPEADDIPDPAAFVDSINSRALKITLHLPAPEATAILNYAESSEVDDVERFIRHIIRSYMEANPLPTRNVAEEIEEIARRIGDDVIKNN